MNSVLRQDSGSSKESLSLWLFLGNGFCQLSCEPRKCLECERCLTGTKAISQILRKENWFRHEYPEASYEKWVVTSSHFSRQAKTEAEIGGIILINRETLQEWLTREV